MKCLVLKDQFYGWPIHRIKANKLGYVLNLKIVNCSSQQQNYNVKAFISIIMSFMSSDCINLWVASTRLVRFNSLTFKFNYKVFKYVNVWFSYPLRVVLLKYLL